MSFIDAAVMQCVIWLVLIRLCLGCFVVRRQGPQQNVNTTINTFVCTQCAGIHRKFNHKVKTINMSTFSQAEVDALTATGNKRAKKQWLASFEEGKSYALDPEDPANIDRFMTMVYVEKRWVKRPGDPDKDDDDDKKKDKKKDAKKEEKPSKRKESVNDRAFDEATFPASIAVTTTVPAAAAAPPAKPAPSATDLGIDFLSGITESTPSSQPKSSNGSNGSIGFDSFDAPTSRPQPAFDNSPHSSMPLFGETVQKAPAPSLSASPPSSTVVQQLLAGMRAIQSQHDLTITQLTMAVQAALVHLQPAAASAASSSAAAAALVSPVSSVASSSSKPERNLADAFEGLSVPDDGEADTGNPFDSSDDDDDQTPSSNQHYSRQYRAHASGTRKRHELLLL